MASRTNEELAEIKEIYEKGKNNQNQHPMVILTRCDVIVYTLATSLGDLCEFYEQLVDWDSVW